MRLALVRHPSVAIAPGICYGRLDVGLAADAQAEIAAAAEQLHAFAGARLWTSPAQRCRIMTESLEQQLCVRAREDRRLRELDFGDWEGAPWASLDRVALDAWAADPLSFAPPGGETGRELVTRVSAFYEESLQAGEHHVVVSHGGPLRVLDALAAGRPIDLLVPSIGMGEVRLITSGAQATQQER